MNMIMRIKHGAMVLIPFDGSCVMEPTIVLRQSRCECKMKVMRKEEQSEGTQEAGQGLLQLGYRQPVSPPNRRVAGAARHPLHQIKNSLGSSGVPTSLRGR